MSNETAIQLMNLEKCLESATSAARRLAVRNAELEDEAARTGAVLRGLRRDILAVAEAIGVVNHYEGQGAEPGPIDTIVEYIQKAVSGMHLANELEPRVAELETTIRKFFEASDQYADDVNLGRRDGTLKTLTAVERKLRALVEPRPSVADAPVPDEKVESGCAWCEHGDCPRHPSDDEGARTSDACIHCGATDTIKVEGQCANVRSCCRRFTEQEAEKILARQRTKEAPNHCVTHATYDTGCGACRLQRERARVQRTNEASPGTLELADWIAEWFRADSDRSNGVTGDKTGERKVTPIQLVALLRAYSQRSETALPCCNPFASAPCKCREAGARQAIEACALECEKERDEYNVERDEMKDAADNCAIRIRAMLTGSTGT